MLDAPLNTGYSGKMKTTNSVDKTGLRIGRLVALCPVGRTTDGHTRWLCQCDCGKTCEVGSNNFREKGGARSCGCLRSEAQKRRIKRDGVWNDSKSYAINCGERCYKTKHGWAKAVLRHYGNKCSKCGWDEAKCDTHHVVPKSAGGKHTVSNGVVLCPNCHRKEHEKCAI